MTKSLLNSVVFFLLVLTITASTNFQSPNVCIIGSGIAGTSVAHFLRQYSTADRAVGQIRIFDKNNVVGGRMATVSVSGEIFEAGASILHPKNFHARNFCKSLSLKIRKPSKFSPSFGIWDGQRFIFKTLSSNSKHWLVQCFVSLANSIRIFTRYGFSLFSMNNFVENTVDSFLKYYGDFESRPVFEKVEDMLQWAGLYNLTTRTLKEELIDAGLSPLLIHELVTVITRINYGQSVSISGLAGAVSLAGSAEGLWSVEGGNWLMAAGLVNHSDVDLHLHDEIESVSYHENFYELSSSKGICYTCEVTVVATPLDEIKIGFIPVISIPNRELQHTHATFVRGILNPAYFGLHAVSDIPDLVGTIEAVDLPFSSISVLKEHNAEDITYKIFSREPLSDAFLDQIFRRNESIRINWAAYPHYHAPERFAPFLLDGKHLYYVNAFENAASTIETSAVAAENIARLILSRISQQLPLSLNFEGRSRLVTSGLYADL